jgi:hypothetical protein
MGLVVKKNLKIYLSTEAENSPPHLTVKGLNPAAALSIEIEKNVKKGLGETEFESWSTFEQNHSSLHIQYFSIDMRPII